MAVRYDIAVGLTKGHKTTKIRRVNYKGDKKVKGLRGASVKNVSFLRKFCPTNPPKISLGERMAHYLWKMCFSPCILNDDNKLIHSKTSNTLAQFAVVACINILLMQRPALTDSFAYWLSYRL